MTRSLESVRRQYERARIARERSSVAVRWLSPAHERLRDALDELRRVGREPLCAGPEGEAWTSEDDDVRAAAAVFCGGCPVLEPCGIAGKRETFGVWAGVDRRPPRPRTRRAAK